MPCFRTRLYRQTLLLKSKILFELNRERSTLKGKTVKLSPFLSILWSFTDCNASSMVVYTSSITQMVTLNLVTEHNVLYLPHKVKFTSSVLCFYLFRCDALKVTSAWPLKQPTGVMFSSRTFWLDKAWPSMTKTHTLFIWLICYLLFLVIDMHLFYFYDLVILLIHDPLQHLIYLPGL